MRALYLIYWDKNKEKGPDEALFPNKNKKTKWNPLSESNKKKVKKK